MVGCDWLYYFFIFNLLDISPKQIPDLFQKKLYPNLLKTILKFDAFSVFPLEIPIVALNAIMPNSQIANILESGGGIGNQLLVVK